MPDIEILALKVKDSKLDTIHLRIEYEKLIELDQVESFCKSIVKPPHSKKLPFDDIKYYFKADRIHFKKYRKITQ